jgi:outer membrane lipoprotein-sorting protein
MRRGGAQRVGGMTRRALARAFAALALALGGAPAFAFELPELMALLARQRSGEARFTEQRFVSGLDAPLASSGTLSFAAPDRFTRRTLAPRAETMAVDGNTLTLTRGARSRSFALDAAPEMAALVESVRGTLTGNAALLQSYFDTRLAGSERAWTLNLEPRDAALAAQVLAVSIQGQGAELRSIEMRLAGGDRSVMTITPQPAAAASAP